MFKWDEKKQSRCTATPDSLPTYGIIAGRGLLPQLLAQHCHKNNISYYIYSFHERETADTAWLAAHPHGHGRLGAVATTVAPVRLLLIT